MYTPNMKGVRIKLPKRMFNAYSIDTDGINNIVPNFITLDSLVPKEHFFNEDFWILSNSTSPYKIEYTDNESLLKPKIVRCTDYGNRSSMSTGEVGKYKAKIWEFQSEYRFKFFMLPLKDKFGNKIDNPIGNIYKILSSIEPNKEYFDIPIKKSSFEKMEITLGPKCSYSEEIIVKSLVNSLNPKARLITNKLSGKIK